MNEVTICNQGLYRIGSSVRITSLDESVERTENVRQAAFWYPLARDRLLEFGPWGFARKAVALAQVTDTTFPGWQYIYEYPSDCVHACAVCDSGGMRSPAFWASCYPWGYRFNVLGKVPFQVGSRADGNSNVIMTDIPVAYLYYIFRQTVTNTFSPLFVDALGWEVGADIGQALQTKQDRVDRARGMAANSRLTAMAQMLNEAQQDQEQESPSISVRC